MDIYGVEWKFPKMNNVGYSLSVNTVIRMGTELEWLAPILVEKGCGRACKFVCSRLNQVNSVGSFLHLVIDDVVCRQSGLNRRVIYLKYSMYEIIYFSRSEID